MQSPPSRAACVFFNLLAGNGQVIGSSEMYESEASRDNGIASVKSNGPTATTQDLSGG